MMTGNTVRCFDALADLRFGTFFRHAGMITSYVTGVSLFVTLKHLQQKCLHLQKTPTLVWVARVAAMLFGISDVTGSLTVGAGSDGGAGRHAFRLIPMALGFGMINAAVTEATGTVTNAVTGHWTKVGFGTAERLLVPDQTTKGFSTSIKAIGTFILSLLSTNLIYQWVETKPLILSKLPPLGVGLGSLYFALLSWYSRAETSS